MGVPPRTDAEVNQLFKEMYATGRWSPEVLSEALRQTWIARGVPTVPTLRPSGPTLMDLLDAPPPVKIMKRRVATKVKNR